MPKNNAEKPLIVFILKLFSGGSKRGVPPTDQSFLNFMQFLGKIWQI